MTPATPVTPKKGARKNKRQRTQKTDGARRGAARQRSSQVKARQRKGWFDATPLKRQRANPNLLKSGDRDRDRDRERRSGRLKTERRRARGDTQSQSNLNCAHRRRRGTTPHSTTHQTTKPPTTEHRTNTPPFLCLPACLPEKRLLKAKQKCQASQPTSRERRRTEINK